MPAERDSLNNMSEFNHQQFSEDIGYIKGKVESIEGHLEKLNGTTENNTKKLAKHDVVLGKIGMVFTAMIFVLTTAFNFVIDWVKNIFS